MVTIIKTEFIKLKRYFIIWIGVSLMLLTVLLTLFTTMADDGMTWDYQFLFEQVVKNFVTMIFPMCITLISGYMISREYTDDTTYFVPKTFGRQIDCFRNIVSFFRSRMLCLHSHCEFYYGI